MLCPFPFGLAIVSNASLEAAAVLRGHANSISAVHAVSGGGGGAARAYTGDWSGHVCVWDVACVGEGGAEADGGGGVSTTQVCACIQLRSCRQVWGFLAEVGVIWSGGVGRVVTLSSCCCGLED